MVGPAETTWGHLSRDYKWLLQRQSGHTNMLVSTAPILLEIWTALKA
jgi:hypothetical protein